MGRSHNAGGQSPSRLFRNSFRYKARAWKLAVAGVEAGSKWRPMTEAQYVSLLRVLPLDPAASRWKSTQGILEMAYGGGKWFTTPAAARLCRPATGRLRKKPKGRQDIPSPLKGSSCVGPAPRWRYPELVVINGSEHSDAGRGNLMYADTEGNVLDLSKVFSTRLLAL